MSEITRPFKYKKLADTDNKYVEWSGHFKTKAEAKEWYKKHGVFHEQRGHKLQLFFESTPIK